VQACDELLSCSATATADAFARGGGAAPHTIPPEQMPQRDVSGGARRRMAYRRLMFASASA